MARTADGARGVGGVFALCSLYSVPRVVCWAAPKHGSSATKLRRLRQRSCYSACGAVSLDGAALYAAQFAVVAAVPPCDCSGCSVVAWGVHFLLPLGTHAHRCMPQHAYRQCSAV